jgi:hypothetical protein
MFDVNDKTVFYDKMDDEEKTSITFAIEDEQLSPTATFIFRRRTPDDQYIYIFDRNHQKIWLNIFEEIAKNKKGSTTNGIESVAISATGAAVFAGMSSSKQANLVTFFEFLQVFTSKITATGESKPGAKKRGGGGGGGDGGAAAKPAPKNSTRTKNAQESSGAERLITPEILKNLIDIVGGPSGVSNTRVLFIPINIDADDNLESLKTRLFTFCSLGADILEGRQLYFWSDYVTSEIDPKPQTKQLSFTAINIDFTSINPWISPSIDPDWVMDDGTKIEDNQIILNNYRTFRDLGIKNTHTIIQVVKAEDLVSSFITTTNSLQRIRWFWGYIYKYFPEISGPEFIDSPFSFSEIKELRSELTEAVRVFQYQYKFLETINNIPIVLSSDKLRGSIRRYNIIFSHIDNAHTTELLDRLGNKTASRRINDRSRLINIQ